MFVNINLVFSYFPDAHTLNLEALVIRFFCEFEMCKPLIPFPVIMRLMFEKLILMGLF